MHVPLHTVQSPPLRFAPPPYAACVTRVHSNRQQPTTHCVSSLILSLALCPEPSLVKSDGSNHKNSFVSFEMLRNLYVFRKIT